MPDQPEAPPPPPLPPQAGLPAGPDFALQSPAQPRGLTLGVVVTWAIIVVSIAWVLIQSRIGQANLAEPLGGSDSRRAQETLALTIQGRFLVGIKTTTADVGRPNTIAVADNLRTLDRMVKTPSGEIRVAILAGEFQDAQVAIFRLDSLLAGSNLNPVQREAGQTLRKLYADGPPTLSAGERQQLIDRLGWFGQLALSFGKPAGDPDRTAAIAPAVRTCVLVIVGVLGALVAGGLGLVLLGIALLRMLNGRFHWALVQPPLDRTNVTFEIIGVWFVVFLGGGLLIRQLAPDSTTKWSWIVYLMVLLTPLWPLCRGLSWVELRQALGWHAGRGVVREMCAGLMGYLAALPLLAVALVITQWLASRTGVQPTHPIVFELTRSGPWRLLALFLLAGVWAPIVEEAVFRGALYPHIRSWAGTVLAALLSGFIFAVIHPQGLVGLPIIMTLGFMLAMIRQWRSSLVASMTAHAFNNCAMLTFFILVMR